MPPYTLFSLVVLATSVLADSTITAPPTRRTAYADVAGDIAKRQAPASPAPSASPLPLTAYQYEYDQLPYQVNPYPVGRGPQVGYNRCNETTEGPDSMCQTAIMNSLDDFCIWGAPEPNSHMGDIEARVVAYCSKPGHGARLLAPGSITGAHFVRTGAYIQITGTFKQTAIGLTEDDSGGELDPHGADLLGNPLGGLMYSTGMPTGDNSTYKQVRNWNNFVGNNLFCIKLCDNSITSPNYCENRYDLLGCAYNMPGNYDEGSFTSCDSDLQDVVGVYTGSDGQTTTWTQPYPLPNTPLPWTPTLPKTSNCVTYSSAQLYGSASGTASATASGASTTSGSTRPTGSSNASGSRSASATGSGATPTAANDSESDAAGVRASGFVAAITFLVMAFIA